MRKDEEPRPGQEVKSRIKADPELRPPIEDVSDGCSHFDAAGDMLFRVAREQSGLGRFASWLKFAAIEPREIDGVSRVGHQRLNGWESFFSRLRRNGRVRRASYDESAYGGPPVKALGSEAGPVAVRFGGKCHELPLRVETTIQDAAQTESVKEYVAHRRL